MKQYISALALVVPDYDVALAVYVDRLGFDLMEDVPQGDGKRWVTIAPPGSSETRLLLAKAVDEEQERSIGHQAGGRVFMFLTTDDFDRDHANMSKEGVEFLEAAREEVYGKVAVFTDPFGNKWDLIQPAID